MTEQMKPSGLVWMGDIPNEWDVKRIKYVISDIKDGTHGTFDRVETGELLLSAKNVFNDGVHIGNNESEISYKDFSSIVSNGFPRRNDVLLCCVGTIGRCCVYDFDKPMAFQRSVSFLRPLSKTSPRFLKYALQSYSTNVQEQLLLNKSAQEGLYMGSVREMVIPFPNSYNAQETIANFLDIQCTKIDGIIADIEKQLELLKKYKLSIITEQTCPLDKTGWKKTKIKYIGDIRGRIGFRGYTVDDTVDPETPGCAVVLGGTNIMKDGTTNYDDLTYLSEEKYFESPEIMLWGGEILITKVGAGTGENSVYDGRFERATTNPNVMIYLPNKDVDSTFINYLLLSKTIKDDMKVESTKSGAQPAINQSYIKNLHIMIPPIKEQKWIAATLKRQCAIVDEIIEKKQQQLSSIQQHKKSLIYEYVTGKKRVTEVN